MELQQIWEHMQQLWDYLELPIVWVLQQFGVSANDKLMIALVILEIIFALIIINMLFRLLSADVGRFFGGPTKAQTKHIRRLKKSRNFTGLGDYYAERHKPRKAVRWYTKAGAHERAADQLLRIGKTSKAAELFSRAGNPKRAAEVLAGAGQWAEAARYFEAANEHAAAADAWKRASDHGHAADAYLSALKERPVPEAVWNGADQLLRDSRDSASIDATRRHSLARALADSAPDDVKPSRLGELYDAAGMPEEAAEQFQRAGHVNRALKCFEQAGNELGAARMRGVQLQKQGEFFQAAQEFEKAEDWTKAGECYEAAEEHDKAAKCFEEIGEPMHAAEEYAADHKWDQAIRVLQSMPADHPEYDRSRLLLGRCFYEMGDYEHCAAALENELQNQRVNRSNIDNYYMLALAYEQLGRLEDASNLLYRVHTVDVRYRDVSHRLSNIASRISMEVKQGSRAPSSGILMAGQHGSGVMVGDAPPNDGASTRVMDTEQKVFAGRYRLESELGRGGMGVVYKAHDLQLDRDVALKFLGTVHDEQRFLREARAAAHMIHPNIVAVYDFSAAEGQSYLAMEYINGQGLNDYMRERGSLSSRETVNITKQVCAALMAVHEIDIVHRDIKPANILIGKGGMVKLTDFGLAKGGEFSSELTGSGLAVGTPSYMPPEQVLGKKVDVRTDIYALGLVIYECLIGKEVFGEGDILERQLNEDPPPPSQVGVTLPPELDDIILKCIAKAPENRFQTAEELLDALRSVRH